MKHARGTTFEEIQTGDDKAVKARALLTSGDPKTVFVVFLGGITFTEIAALRFVAKKLQDCKCETWIEKPRILLMLHIIARKTLVICTTSIINGNRMMATAVATKAFGNSAETSNAG